MAIGNIRFIGFIKLSKIVINMAKILTFAGLKYPAEILFRKKRRSFSQLPSIKTQYWKEIPSYCKIKKVVPNATTLRDDS